MKFTIIFLFFFAPLLFSAENEERPHIYKTVLTIAGSDSCGGAGVQADLKTFSALRCYGMNAITAITAQNTMGVQFIEPISTTCIAMQLASLFDDIEIHAIKIGMLGSKEIKQHFFCKFDLLLLLTA
jgi:hydroxymethylpyrimidine kinase/phosphomethylpyrimidine kinase